MRDIANTLIVIPPLLEQQPKLALIRLKTSLIPMPPLEEQKRIAQMYKHLLLPVSDL